MDFRKQDEPRRIPVHDCDSRAAPNPAADALARAAPETAESIDPPLAELKARVAELNDRYLRAAADLDNYRKRFNRELERLRRAERENLLLAWLDVVDNMERALTAEGAASNPWFEGMEAIHQQMLGTLKRFGAEPFDARGEAFDPARHDAVAAAHLPGRKEGEIVEVVQTGYTLNGKVLRPAKVIPVKRT
ncbi:MAG: nucleotide exchange factor GrpE [Candidatus Sumerlaeota bacterium]|nr:nucleotide exchange factor GrpE [Candidatus Sumerlaeota bacterium]